MSLHKWSNLELYEMISHPWSLLRPTGGSKYPHIVLFDYIDCCTRYLPEVKITHSLYELWLYCKTFDFSMDNVCRHYHHHHTPSPNEHNIGSSIGFFIRCISFKLHNLSINQLNRLRSSGVLAIYWIFDPINRKFINESIIVVSIEIDHIWCDGFNLRSFLLSTAVFFSCVGVWRCDECGFRYCYPLFFSSVCMSVCRLRRFRLIFYCKIFVIIWIVD